MQVAALKSQSAQPCEVLIIDSGSVDDTVSIFRGAGYRVHTIAPAQFDHGGTRNLGAALVDPRADLLVFLTQDAIPANAQALARLLHSFTDADVAMAYGRQLPRPEAGPIERHARLFNYGDTGLSKRLPAARALGIKAVFASNSFAAYRRSIFNQLGGFATPVIMGEDQVFAARALQGGWTVVYAARAEAVHSHGYTPLQEFRRYFDTGVYHAAFPMIAEQFGGVGGEGFAFIRSEVAYLGRTAPHLIPLAALHWVAKYTGYRIGRHAARLPARLRPRLAMHKGYFRRLHAGAAPTSVEVAD
ncbi:O antigen biosynthesis rhamnosyltransferase RfbN [Rhodovastum atsumiense]|nr:O antigen biosynthesis rhamnosyltransferase RfbN [Rhodovastum atsumiense]